MARTINIFLESKHAFSKIFLEFSTKNLAGGLSCHLYSLSFAKAPLATWKSLYELGSHKESIPTAL